MRDRIASRLNPVQIVEALRLVREYVDAVGDPDFCFGYTQAVRWWRKAAHAGIAAAQNSLGDAYSNMLGDAYCEGRGFPPDDAEAVTWYRRAAEQGAPCSPAQSWRAVS